MGAYTVTHFSIVPSLLIMFFSKGERLSWAVVCPQMLSPSGQGSIFVSLNVKVDTIFTCLQMSRAVFQLGSFLFTLC